MSKVLCVKFFFECKFWERREEKGDYFKVSSRSPECETSSSLCYISDASTVDGSKQIFSKLRPLLPSFYIFPSLFSGQASITDSIFRFIALSFSYNNLINLE